MTIGDPVIESGMSDLDYHAQESPFADDGTCEQCNRVGKHDTKCPVGVADFAESRGAEESSMKVFGGALIIIGLLGLLESAKWASVQSDRVMNFAVGAFLFLVGFFILHGGVR